MLHLAAQSAFSFFWRSESSQWVLKPAEGGQRAVPVSPTPFVIGRALDCQLVLPQEAAPARTSRWHCHILERGGRLELVDGSLREAPETGKPKPSVGGTFLNGRKLSLPHPISPGDTLAVGPWGFLVQEGRREEVDIDDLLSRVGAADPREIEASDPKLREGFAQLHELFRRLNETQGADEGLAAILAYAAEKIRNVQVAAVLTDGPEGVRTRLAWARGRGRITDFRFSAGLVRGLPPDRSFLLEASLADPTRSQKQESISSGLLVPLWGNHARLGILYMDNRSAAASFTEEDLYLANALASLTSWQLVSERQSFLSRVEFNMSRFFGPDVVSLILQETRAGRPLLPGVKEREASVLFLDLEGFSAFCRNRPPAEVGDLLNPYFEVAADCIQRHGGHVDKFIGDGVLGVFGAPPVGEGGGSGPNHAAQAVRAARDAIRAWSKGPGPLGARLPVRAGIDTGRVVVGNIGFSSRMEYSVLGDVVNLASRLEKLAPPGGIALSESTRRLLGEEFPLSAGEEAEVKGFGTVRVWRLSA